MATDATGTPTAKGIPKFNTAVDKPTGKGFNAAMDAIDLLLQGIDGMFKAADIMVNGSFGIWQRGNGPFTADGFSADFWQLTKGAGSTVSILLDAADTVDPSSARSMQKD